MLASGEDESGQQTKAEVKVTLAEAMRSFAFWGSVLAAGIRNGSYHAICGSFRAFDGLERASANRRRLYC